MMTKEEVIKDLIDMAKNGVNNPLDAYCDSCSCLTCPFHSDENGECPDVMVGELIDRLLKAEEHQETNLEHYASKSLTERYGYSPFMSCDTDTLAIALKDGWEKTFNWSDPIQWLLEPYKPPKFKLTQLEYDLLDYCSYKQCDDTLKDWTVLMDMQNKGHYKDIPKEIKIRAILDNCEVTDK